jgi:hypothetical protein
MGINIVKLPIRPAIISVSPIKINSIGLMTLLRSITCKFFKKWPQRPLQEQNITHEQKTLKIDTKRRRKNKKRGFT